MSALTKESVVHAFNELERVEDKNEQAALRSILMGLIKVPDLPDGDLWGVIQFAWLLTKQTATLKNEANETLLMAAVDVCEEQERFLFHVARGGEVSPMFDNALLDELGAK